MIQMEWKDKLKKEIELIEYFTQFEKEGVKISVYKGKTEIPINIDESGNMASIVTPDKSDRVYIIPSQINDDYNTDLFESFYQLQYAKQNNPEPLFIKFELQELNYKFPGSIRIDSVFNTLRQWEYFLEEKQKSIEEQPKKIQQEITKKIPEIGTACWAYYYHILHTVEPKTRFDNDQEGKIKAIERIAKHNEISTKNFQLQYNALEDPKKANQRTNKGKISTLKRVVKMFEANSPAQKLAQEYLNKALENK
jgi:hypothetical protein